MSTSTDTYDLVVLSNRLPVDHQTAPDGSTVWKRSPGGLVTALEPVVAESHGVWIGWPGVTDRDIEPFDLPDADGRSLFHIIPISLTEQEFEDYYEGFSNGTLWPLYHDVIATPEYHRQWWEAYQKVNKRFAEAAARATAPCGVVWVHDYQLQLVPQYLRELRPDVRIGFFNHIPFPPFGIFAQLPWRSQIVTGLLGADVIGFQRASDARNYARAVRRLTGLTTRGGVVELPAKHDLPRRTVLIDDYPISIDAHDFETLAQSEAVQARAKAIRQELGNPKWVLLGVDRLDYTKGIRHRIKAFGEMLEDGEVSVDDVTLVQVAVPSRERVESYRVLRDEIELSIARINGDYGKIGKAAINYLHQGYPREEMVAMYLAADVLLVTALRDGMNLVAKEYVATRVDERGVLVLSEFAGAADQLKTALLINPHDIDGLKQAILTAMSMKPAEQRRRMRAMRRRVREDDVAQWSANFFQDLAPKMLAKLQASGAAKASKLTGRSIAMTPPRGVAGEMTASVNHPHVADQENHTQGD